MRKTKEDSGFTKLTDKQRKFLNDYMLLKDGTTFQYRSDIKLPEGWTRELSYFFAVSVILGNGYYPVTATDYLNEDVRTVVKLNQDIITAEKSIKGIEQQWQES